MKDKKIKNLLKNEGNIMFSSSFDGVKNKLGKNLNFVEEKKQKNEFKSKRTSIITLSLTSVGIVAVICAIVFPVIKNNGSVLPNNPTLCDVEITNNDQSQVLRLAFDVNAQGKVSHSSLYAKNELGKKVLAGMKAKKFTPKSLKVEEYTVELLNFAKSTFDKENKPLITLDDKNYFVVRTEGPGAENVEFNEKYLNKLNELLANDNFAVAVRPELSTFGTLNKDLLLARKHELNFFIGKLFGHGSDVIYGFKPDDNFMQSSSITEVENALTKIREIYEAIPLDKNLNDFKTDLNYFSNAYKNRGEKLLNAMQKCDEASKEILGSANIDEVDNLKSFIYPDELPQVGWWLNTTNDSTNLDQLVQFDFDDKYSEYAKHCLIPGYQETEENNLRDDQSKEERVRFLMDGYNTYSNMLKLNQTFLSRFMDILPIRSSIVDDYGRKSNHPSYSYKWTKNNYFNFENNYWNEYWK